MSKNKNTVIARNAGEGNRYEYYNTLIEEVLSMAETGQMSLMRITMTPHTAPPLHIHTHEDEFWIVVSGKVRFWFGGDSLESCSTRDVGSGGVVFGPRLISHTFETITPTSEILIGANPGNIEAYFHGIGKDTERKDSEHLDFLGEFGVTIIDRAPNLHGES